MLRLGLLLLAPLLVAAGSDCIPGGDTQEYTGTNSVTEDGLTCLPWTWSESPKTVDQFRNENTLEEASNYCRDPGGENTRVWCYTGFSLWRKWGYCHVPSCSTGGCDKDEGRNCANFLDRCSDPKIARYCCKSCNSGKPAPTKKPSRPSPNGVPTVAEAAAREEQITSSDLFKSVKKSIKTLDSSVVDQIAPGKADNPANVKRLEKLLKESDWEFLFPQRNEQYTYRKFLQAVGKFPMICGDYADKDADAVCKKTLTTIFAHFVQETGGHAASSAIPEWRQGLIHLTEMGCSQASSGCGYNTECNPGTWQSKAWPCGKASDGSFKKYFGRGAKQMSYNYNYGPFSDAMYGTVSTLLDNPELVATTWLNLASATWFYAYPQPPKPSMLHVVDGTWQPNAQDKASNLVKGFGVTTMIINGGIECGHGVDKPQAANRQKYYKAFSKYFKVDITGEELSCANMKPFAVGGAGSLSIYWDKNWGAKYECKLVSYQTPHNALKPGDFGRCVEERWNVNLA